LGSACCQTRINTAINYCIPELGLLVLGKSGTGTAFSLELSAIRSHPENSNAGPQWFFCRTYTRIAVQCTSTAFCSTTLQLQLHITTPQPFHKQHLIFHKLVRSNHLTKHINMVITTAKTK
jgi:hypothetical protein